ncbi:uncharacterized protein LOC135149445 [Daucus carota subsp. sativus]|uniref:uncharacterized protein LOC108201307 n=1 Tax=Daucus carota subsp. sativus TaxID=79200 RepID=UPI0007F00506|nr:PREDICTED: uncharacterized protein LOC108201307 [Daucus carota subsp. sativus]
MELHDESNNTNEKRGIELNKRRRERCGLCQEQYKHQQEPTRTIYSLINGIIWAIFSHQLFISRPSMDYSYLSNINGGVEDWLLRLRVCRLWESTNTRENTLISMDMVLIDEKGNLMHASVPRHLVSRFKRHVSECKLYSLRNVKITTNTYPYRPLASDKKLLFLATIEVVKLDADAVRIGMHGFQFVSLPVLQARADDVTILSGALTFATTSASRIYVNPDEQHVSSVRERFSALSTKVLALEGTSASKLPLEEAMFVNQITVDDLVGATCSGELKAAIATLKVIITAVNTRFEWYYVSCKSCVKKATPVGGVYVCAECKKPVDYPLHM